MNCLVVKFRQRNLSDFSNKCLAEIYVNGPKFDIDLISSDQKVIHAHKYVVSMFSTYLKDYLREFKPKGKACVPLSEISSFVLKQVIDLFYNGQVMIGVEVKPQMLNALRFLKVDNAQIASLDPQPPTEPPSNNTSTPAPKAPGQPPMSQNVNRSEDVNATYKPGKRQRGQSLYCERPDRGGIYTNPSSLQSVVSSHIDLMSITKVNAPVSNLTPRPTVNAQLMQHSRVANGTGGSLIANRRPPMPTKSVQGHPQFPIQPMNMAAKVAKISNMDRHSDDMDISDMNY